MRRCGSDTSEAFVVRLKGRGTQARYATCLGPGTGGGIAVDTQFNAYVSGLTYGSFPTTPGAFQPNKPSPTPGTLSGVVAKLGPAGKRVFSTYFGGNNDTVAESIAVDRTGAIYVAGRTLATQFPGLPPLPPNRRSGFVSKLGPQGKNLLYSTAVGSSIYDLVLFQRPSSPLELHMVGYTGSDELPDAIVVKMY
jgi:hypothetical protein